MNQIQSKSLSKHLLLFTFPIFLTGVLQQLFNVADTAIIGKFASSNALAAVGINGEIVALLVTIASGLSVGVTVRVSSFLGQKKTEFIPEVISSALIFSLISGVLIALCAQFAARPVLQLIGTPPEAMSDAILYLKIYCLGMPFLFLFNFGSAIMRSFGDTRIPMYAMVAAGLVNVLLNLLLVAKFQMGVVGVAAATDVSNLICALVVLFRIKHWIPHLADDATSGRRMVMNGKEVLRIVTIGAPAAIQGAVFCFANIFAQSAINSLGVTVAAGGTIAMNFEYLCYYPITSYGQTVTTFVSEQHAAGNEEMCSRITCKCMIQSILMCLAMSLPLTLLRYDAAALFSGDADVIHAAGVRLLIMFLLPICAVYECLGGSIRGRGNSLLPAIITIVGTCALRIIWFQTVFQHVHTEMSLYTVFPISWALTSCMMITGYAFTIKKNRVVPQMQNEISSLQM